jgi:aryl-phospho-beta-D-glucosidase BglC (GH1 family)
VVSGSSGHSHSRVCLAYDKWDVESRDFLMGDASDYKGLVRKDLDKLKEVLSWADACGLKVVLVPLSLPGRRWHQRNGDRHDSRLWENYCYQEMAIRFWADLARELSDYDCIVAHDILNEPCPEHGTDIREQTKIGDVQHLVDWYSRYKNTPRDLWDFYGRIIKAIREVDDRTPIMVEPGFYGQVPAYGA